MPIARIPNKVLTLMQTEDKKMGKIVSLQKNLEWSTKEVLGSVVGGGILRGWKWLGELWSGSISGNTLLGRLQVLVICCGGSGRSWGKCPQPWGVGRGSFSRRPGLRLQGKAPFPSTERHVIYTEKEQKIMAGGGVGVNSCSEGFSDGRKTERWRICSHLAPNRLRATRVFPAASAAWDICCYFFFFT